MNEELSIVMPVFNEAKVIGQVVGELDAEILSRFEHAELVVVDDASTDDSPRILDELAASSSAIRVEHAQVNRGHGPSLRRAIASSRGDWIFHIDSDRQFVASEFWNLWQVRENADLVLGVRRERRDALHRLILSAVVRVVVSLLAGQKIRDANVPFRLFRRELWRELGPAIGETARAPSIMVSLAAAARGARIVEIPVTHLPRAHGPSTLRLLKLARFSLAGLGELLVFRYRLSRRKRAR